MKIDRIELNNFRKFEKASFEFPSNFTVLIGENGKGKSSVLQAVRVAAATFLLGIDEVERYHIQKEDVRRIDAGNRFAPTTNCFFNASGMVNNEEVAWKRTLPRLGGKTDTKDANALISIAKSLNSAVNESLQNDVSLPVLCYFSTARLWSESKQTFNLKKKGSKLKDGYIRCLEARNDKVSPMEWIKSAYWKKLKNKEESVLFDAVLEAIDQCIPQWKPLEWDEDSDDLGGVFTDPEGQESFIPLYYLSDGLRTMASMVAEIAYRCAVLNEHLGKDAVRESRGVVLIDEIDMHLHPKWQQGVVGDLKKAFPHIQFIATTHSPFIVQSLAAEELINLDAQVDEEPYKLSIQEVASHIMKVEPRSLLYQQQYHKATDYFKALEGLHDESEETINETLAKIETEEAITDPAFAAFLKMNRLAKIESKKAK